MAYALIKCAEKLHYDADVAYEMVLINDNTPVKHVNIIARQMLGKNELKVTAELILRKLNLFLRKKV